MKKVKGFAKTFLNIVLSGLTAFIILNLIFAGYSQLPFHVESTLGNTDYVWPANSRWMRMTEGISHGRFDARGFNNPEAVERPDILILGSSHMEAICVCQNQSTAYFLQKNFEDRKTVYNMGISGHTLAKVLQYLPETLEIFDPVPEAIVIETSSLFFSPEDVERILNHSVDFTPSHDYGIISILQKSSFFRPFLRDLYQQWVGGMSEMLFPPIRSNHSARNRDKIDEPVDLETFQYDKLLSRVSELEKKYGTRLVIFYHPKENLQKDGTVLFERGEFFDIFSRKCEEYGIEFLDMTDAFCNMYRTEHKLPHGFITGEIGTGHINADGHRVIADELHRLLTSGREG